MLAAPLIFAVYDAPDGVEDAGVRLLVLFLPQMLFYGWMALGSAVLNAKRRFVVPAFAPVLNNIVVCAALIAFGLRAGGDAGLGSVTDDRTGLLLLGLGTTAGIVAMTLPLLPAIRYAGVPALAVRARHAAVTVLRRGGWTLGYVAANQIGLTVMLAVAARTTEGLPSWYTYAFIFFQLPHGLIAVSVMTTFVPELASAWGNDDVARYRARFSQGLRLVWTGWSPPPSCWPPGLGAAGGRTAGRGAFGEAAADGTGDVLATMALGLPGFSAYLFALRSFYAWATPVRRSWPTCSRTAPGRPDRRRRRRRRPRGPRHAYAIAYSGRRPGPRPPPPAGRGDRHPVPGRRRFLRLVVAAAAAPAPSLVVRSLLPDDTEALVEAVAVALAGVAVFVAAGLAVGLAEIKPAPAPSRAEGGRPSLQPHVQGDPSVVEVHDRQALLLVQREGRSQGPARAGDHGGPGAAPAAEGAGGQRHRQPEADRAAPEPVLDELEKVTGNARQAVLMADEATKKGDADKATEYTSAAEAFANRLIALEAEVEDLKTLHLQSTQASDQAKHVVSQNSEMLQKKLSERQRLLGQLDQAKMQEQMNRAMSSLSETVGEDVPTLDEVRDKIEARYAKAKGMSELTETSVESRMLEIEQAARNSEAQGRLAEIRAQLGLSPAPTEAEDPGHRVVVSPPATCPRHPGGGHARRLIRGGPRGRRDGPPRAGCRQGARRAAAGDAARGRPPRRARPLPKTVPSGPATSTASPASKDPSTPTTPAGGDTARRRRRTVVDPDDARGRTAKPIHSLRAARRAARGTTTVPTPGVPATASASTSGRVEGAITVRTPDQAAILAAATFEAMPPLPRRAAPPASASMAWSTSTISSISDADGSSAGRP